MGAGENILIIARPSAFDIYQQYLPDDIFIEWTIDDIWMRDFGPAVMHKQVA